MTPEDYTAAALKGIPKFLVGREYVESTPLFFMKVRYAVVLSNGVMVSIVEFREREMIGGYQYEMMVIDPNGVPFDYDTSDAQRGNASEINDYLTELEQYGLERKLSL